MKELESLHFDPTAVPTPCYIVDEARLRRNLELLQRVQQRSGAKILLAQKAFSMYRTYPMIREYLAGSTASGLYEAKLAREEMGGEVHIYSPAYKPEEFDEILRISDHIVFNSCAQWKRYRDQVQACGRKISCGLRINPEYAETETDLYNPCFTGSRLGITLANLEEDALEGLDGLHFHTMCEQNSDTLERTLRVVEEKFGRYLSRMQWVNFGGGHHITRPDYDVELLIRLCRDFAEKYHVQVYLEPGEAVALHAGYLVTQVLDFVHNGLDIAIVDASAACHMPDVLEMPYTPPLYGAKIVSQDEQEKNSDRKYVYRLSSYTCLAGDVIGDYAFEHEINIGDRLIFMDMAIYSMVKNNTFNGIPLPSISLLKDGRVELIKSFGYEDFKGRLS